MVFVRHMIIIKSSAHPAASVRLPIAYMTFQVVIFF